MTKTSAMMARRLSAALLVAALGLAARPATAACSDAAPVAVTTVNRTFSGGSSWRFDVLRKRCEGLVISAAFFKPAGGTLRQVLAQGNIAEIQVPSVTGTPRNLDLTANSEGLGDTNTAGTSWVTTLSATECGGTLHDQNRVCVVNEDGEYRWRGGDREPNGEFTMAQRVVVFMSTQVGKENYINRWEFNDDGAIEVLLGVSGQVPFTKTSSSYAAYGSRLDKSSNTTPKIGLAHLHNVYYRLDFDLDGWSNDVVSQRKFSTSMTSPETSICQPGECGRVDITPITREQAQSWSPTAQTVWTIEDAMIKNADGRSIGYEISPEIQGIWAGMTSTTEPWAGSELWVTKHKPCELFAVNNTAPALPSSCGTGNKTSLNLMTNDEPLAGQDIVVWYANRMLHDVRDEDESNMAVRWMRFEITPRSFHHEYPVEVVPPAAP